MIRESYLKNSLIPKRYVNDIPLRPSKEDEKTFEELNNIKNNSVEFAKSGKNLLICSNNVGCGKTTWATKILLNFLEKTSSHNFSNQCPGLYINVSNFLNEKKLAITDKDLALKVADIEKKILKSPLVIFDDICVKNISEYDLGNLYYWIDERTSNMKCCIYTSNLLPEDLKKTIDARLYSRIVNYSIIKEIKDGDSRSC